MENKILKENLYQGLREILKDLQLIDETADISGMPLLGAGGTMDSLTAMRLVVEVERRFGVSILDDLDLDCLETTDTLADYLQKRRVAL